MLGIFVAAVLSLSPDEMAAKKVYSHLMIEDSASAVETARAAYATHPQSKAVRLSLIHALCARGQEIDALREWHKAVSEDETLLKDRAALEMLAWSVLNKGEMAGPLPIRLSALVGAALTRDAKAIPLLIDQLRSSNAILRSVAVTLAAGYGDQPLQDELSRLLRDEKVWYVRLEVIKAVGKLRMKEHKERLQEIIAHPKTLPEERVAALVSLVNMYEGIGQEEFQALITSNRAAMRELACEVVGFFELKEEAKKLQPLLRDPHPLVRASALNTLTLLGMTDPMATKLLEDPAPEVALSAARMLLISGRAKGGERLAAWITGGEPKWRRQAAAVLASTGKKGVPLMRRMIVESSDPFVRVNLALGLIGQRDSVERSCQVLDNALRDEGMWMWQQLPGSPFRSLAPSEVRHSVEMPNMPVAVDQMTRLEILSILCMLEYPRALEAVKGFLQEHQWGVTGAAAVTLLREGDEDSVHVVRRLLKDPDEKVRIQAALILSLIGSDEEALKVLKDAYQTVGRPLKIQILEALTHVGDPEMIPFLINVLNEPFQIMRVIAASAIIQCIYH